jgi:acyl-CoA reductase-like NAD-dependent aldehyde dehydrogenase
MTGDLVDLPALGPDGEYRTRNREVIKDTAGVPVAESSIVPRLFVTRSIDAQRRLRPLPSAEREVALTKAADVFLSSTIGGLDFETYVDLTCRVTGLPMTAARAGANTIAESLTTACDAVRPARPTGAKPDWRELSTTGGAVWARRGEVLAVHAPGNAPGVHGLWPQALALGYRITVRPSRREPFTAHRLIRALRQTGFRDGHALYLPTDHTVADDVIGAADLAMVYGGEDVVDRYARDPNVLTNGPGRTKTLITANCDWREYLDAIIDSIANLGGMACVNATAVLYEGDATPLAHAIAERLSTIAPLPNTDERAVLPTTSIDSARAIADHLAARAAGTVPVLGADQVVADLGGGFAALRPAVHLLAAPDPAKLNVELPFPCVWVSPWSRADGIAPLRNSLVLNAITEDDELVDALLNEPTVTNVYRGRHATHHSAPHIPHEGFLADFLMRNKGFIDG